MLLSSEYDLDLHIPKRGKTVNYFSLLMEVGKLYFIFEDNGYLISKYQWIWYDSAIEWKTNVCKAGQPQHHMTIGKVE